MEKSRFGRGKWRLFQAVGCILPLKKTLNKTRGGETGSAGNVFLAACRSHIFSLLCGLPRLLPGALFPAGCGVTLWMHDLGVEPGTSLTLLPETAHDAG